MTERMQREIEQEDGGVEKHRFVFGRFFLFYIIAAVSRLELLI